MYNALQWNAGGNCSVYSSRACLMPRSIQLSGVKQEWHVVWWLRNCKQIFENAFVGSSVNSLSSLPLPLQLHFFPWWCESHHLCLWDGRPLLEMLKASSVTTEIDFFRLHCLPGLRTQAHRGESLPCADVWFLLHLLPTPWVCLTLRCVSFLTSPFVFPPHAVSFSLHSD